MREPGHIERLADGSDPPIHHIGRGNDVAPGLGLHDGLPAQYLDGFVIRHIAVTDDAVMPMRGERVERDIAQHAQPGHGLLQRRNRQTNEIAGV